MKLCRVPIDCIGKEHSMCTCTYLQQPKGHEHIVPGLRNTGLILCRQSEGQYELQCAPHSEQDEQYWYGQQPPLDLEHPRLNESVTELSSNLWGKKTDTYNLTHQFSIKFMISVAMLFTCIVYIHYVWGIYTHLGVSCACVCLVHKLVHVVIRHYLPELSVQLASKVLANNH